MLSRTFSAPCAGARDPAAITAVARTVRPAHWAGIIIAPVCWFEAFPRRIPLSFERNFRRTSSPAGDGPSHRPEETRCFGEDSAVADFCASPTLGRNGQIDLSDQSIARSWNEETRQPVSSLSDFSRTTDRAFRRLPAA